jgi:hypothetical protein
MSTSRNITLKQLDDLVTSFNAVLDVINPIMITGVVDNGAFQRYLDARRRGIFAATILIRKLDSIKHETTMTIDTNVEAAS